MSLMYHFLLVSLMMIFTACSGQSNSTADAQKLANEIQKKASPSGQPASAVLYMKAAVNGKPWTASQLIPDPSTSSNNYRLSGTEGETTIGFYIYTPHMKVGDIREFGDDHAADFITNDDIGFYGGRTGKYMITKLDDQGFEGRFYFTATTERASTKKFEVKDGVFRFPWAAAK